MQVICTYIVFTALLPFLSTTVHSKKPQNYMVEKEVSIVKVPYMLAFIRRLSKQLGDEKFLCGAAIVSRHWAMTAAQCVQSATTQEAIEKGDAFIRGNTNIWKRRANLTDFGNASAGDSDLALLNVKEQFGFHHEKRVALAGKEYVYGVNLPSIMVGWGTQSFSSVPAAERLRWVASYLNPTHICNETFNDKLFRFTENMVCLGGTPLSISYIADYGSPIIQNNVLVGIVTFGGGTEKQESPVAITKVGKYQDWFEKIQDCRKMKLKILQDTWREGPEPC